jgi:hypothetical protein
MLLAFDQSTRRNILLRCDRFVTTNDILIESGDYDGSRPTLSMTNKGRLCASTWSQLYCDGRVEDWDSLEIFKPIG